MITITEAPKLVSVTKIACPKCNERVRFVGLTKDSIIEGLTFKCKACGKFWKVTTQNK